MSTLVTFLLDKSGSMGVIKAQTIEAFNAYLSTLKAEAKATLFSLVQFDSAGLEKTCVRQDVKSVPLLDDRSYEPRGGTPLIDAAYKTIKAVEASLKEMAKKTKVVVCIQTDGEENESRQHSWEALSALIKEKTAAGWQFNFMGCGIDAYAQGAKMGIAPMSTMSYDRHDRAATRSAFAASAMNAASFSTGERANTKYTMEQRAMAKDAWAHKAVGGVPLPTAAVPNVATPMVADLDLTAALAPHKSTPITPASDDFTL